ncbi:MAG TPA: PAS domain-containing protein [Gemmatimonadales bacterium]|nr:PAS domain-containing protein [Gemmatimonadales bacterium]
MAASTALRSAFDVASFINEYYGAWGGTDEDRIMSYYAENVVLQIPGALMKGKEALRDQFVRPFITAFPGNRHVVKKMVFGPGVVVVEFSFEAQHKGPFGGHAATGAQVTLPGCGVYEYDAAKRQITAGRIYFDGGTLLQTTTDSLVDDPQKSDEALGTNERNLSLITNVTPTFIHVLRSDGSVLYVNQAVLSYTGLTLEDVRREDYRARFFHPQDAERLREERAEALTRAEPFENEQRVLGKDGRYRWFLIRYNPLLDAQGRIDRWYVAAFDIEDRKRAEAQVEQAYLFLAEAQRLSKTGSWSWNASTGKVVWSQEHCRILGLDPQDTNPSLDEFWERVHPDDRIGLRRTFESAIRDKRDFEQEFRIVTPDRSIKHLHGVGHAVFDKSHELVEFIGSTMDITDRKRAQELAGNLMALRADVSAALSKPVSIREMLRECAEALVRRLEAAFARIWTANHRETTLELQASAGMYTRLDGTYGRIPFGDLKVGWIASEKKPHLTNDVLSDPRIRDKEWARSCGMVSFAGYPLLVEKRAVGVMAMFARHPLSDDTLDTLASVADAIAQGIERKRSEAELRRSETYLAAAQRLSKTGSFVTDLVADEHNWSEELCRIFEFDPATKITHEAIRRVFHPEDLPIYEAAFKRAVDGPDRDLELAYRIITPAGTVKHVHAVAHVMETVAGRPVFIGAIQDVTESKVAEEALHRARAELAHMARVTTLSALTASIAHEINQPIAAAITRAGACLRWLNRDQPEVQRAREAAMRIEEDGKRAAEIIAHLKSLYKKDVSPQREMVSVNDVVGELLVLLSSEADRHSVVMRTELTADLPSVSADRVQLQQVLMNLMLNGMEAMSERGGELKISTGREGGELTVSVSDTGAGIPSEKMEEIFKAFVTTKAGGTGMGLAISRTIVESHGGRLWATVKPGSGATLHFTLPTEAEAHK